MQSCKQVPKYAFGWRRQLPDFRDKKFVDLPGVNLPVVAPPPSIDMRPMCPPPYNQGQLGSCTGNALAFLCEFDWMKQQKAAPFVPSRLFIYYCERLLEGTVHSDAGAFLRDGIKSLHIWGFPPESAWPYNIAAFAQAPSAHAYALAWKEKVQDYGSVAQDMNMMKTVLASGYPIVIGFTVYESFVSQEVAQTGMVPMPGPNENVVGGHAVGIVGYNSDGWIVRNSWGADWGQQGYFIMPYEYFLNPDLSSDLWVVRFVP